MAGLVLVEGGMVQLLDALRPSWLPSLQIGLFQNDWTPERGDTISRVVPCTFSGYNGLHELPAWSPATLYGDVAISSSQQRLWVHDGGPVQNWVFGTYVVTVGGVLVWAQRDDAGGRAMAVLGQEYRFTPQFAQGSRYG